VVTLYYLMNLTSKTTKWHSSTNNI